MTSDLQGPLRPGERFHDRYRVIRALRAGGMGAVYEVVDERTDGHRALKVMLPSLFGDADLRARFEREAKVTSAVESDHLVRVTDAGVDPGTGTPFLVMELLHGEDLGKVLEARRALPPETAAAFLRQIAPALDRTHAAGVIHRDLKPENLFLTHRDDGSPCLKILDFGIAKVIAEGLARAQGTRPMGSIAYMAPEQIRGEGTLGPAADLYSLAHLTYALLAGEPYWTEEANAASSPSAVLEKVMRGPPEAPTARARRRAGISLPPGFDAWFARGAALSPEARFGSAQEMCSALSDALGLPPPAYTPAPPQAGTLPMGPASFPAIAASQPKVDAPPPKPAKPRSLPLSALLVAMLLGAAAAAYTFGPRPSAEPERGLPPPPPPTRERAPEPARPRGGVGVVSGPGQGKRAIVREGPSRDAREVARLEPGTVVTILDVQRGGWFEIRWPHPDGNEQAWIHGDVFQPGRRRVSPGLVKGADDWAKCCGKTAEAGWDCGGCAGAGE
jgi:serine/threonine-protein kinase